MDFLQRRKVHLEVDLELKTNSIAKPVCPLWATVETRRSQAEGDPNQYTHTPKQTKDLVLQVGLKRLCCKKQPCFMYIFM